MTTFSVGAGVGAGAGAGAPGAPGAPGTPAGPGGPGTGSGAAQPAANGMAINAAKQLALTSFNNLFPLLFLL